MTLQLVEGEYYKTKLGAKFGPTVDDGGYFTLRSPEGTVWHFRSDGVCCYEGNIGALPKPEFDLVSLWTDEPTTQEAGPVQRVMVTKIISGTYGGVFVGERDNEVLPIRIELVQRHFTADELDGVISTLTSLSKALREMKE